MKKILAILLLLPNIVLAETPLGGLQNAAKDTGLITNKTVPQITAQIIQILISFLGLLFVVLIIIGGFRWMTSGGSADKIKEAKQLIINSTIGLVIVLLSYVIVRFVMTEILDQGGEGGAGGAAGEGGGSD